MIFNFKSSVGRRGGIITEDCFTFTKEGGAQADYLFASDDEGNFELALLESGTLTWLVMPPAADLFVVGAGKDGAAGQFINWNAQYHTYFGLESGKGGDAGRVLNASDVYLDAVCTVVVGTNQGESSLISDDVSYSSASGPVPTAGGSKAVMSRTENKVGTVNTGGKAGVYAFGDEDDHTMIPEFVGKRFAASGGAGNANNACTMSYVDEFGNTITYNAYVYTDEHGGVNTGGTTGGGNGGVRNHHNGYAASFYGSGGGGGYGDGSGGAFGTGGAGADGIVMIRNHREA